jgi:uncharacterized SAM-binding protein YcdF (DUF218 family)
VFRGFCALVALVILVPLFVAFQVWYVAREDSHRKSDAIVVLGAAEYNGTPSAILESRLAHALTLYQIGVAKNIVTVGGNRPGDTHTEAGAGAEWLAQHGVPDDRLVAVRTGSDTLASMKAVGAVFKAKGWHTAIIVTDPEHELRSRTMADDNGMNALTSPTRSGVMVESRDTQYHYIIRETGGLLYYYLWGRWNL